MHERQETNQSVIFQSLSHFRCRATYGSFLKQSCFLCVFVDQMIFPELIVIGYKRHKNQLILIFSGAAVGQGASTVAIIKIEIKILI